MPTGVRVVRGPHWKWGDQDGGNGYVGTATLGVREDGWSRVVWDVGMSNNYRTGDEDAYDLRLYDLAPAGVKHKGFNCDECGEIEILGIRWKCDVCKSYDLCTSCYMGDKHNLDHAFSRVDTNGNEPSKVGTRSGSDKTEAKGSFQGATVTRGKDWQWGDQDGGEGSSGTVLAIGKKSQGPGTVTVKWGVKGANVYRLGNEGQVDVQCTKATSGGSFYPEHLPILRVKKKSSSSRDEKLQSAMKGLFADVVMKMLLKTALSEEGDEDKDKSKEKEGTTTRGEAKAAEVARRLATKPSSSSKGGCEYFNKCKRFLSLLKLSAGYLESKGDMCYCMQCHSKRKDKAVYHRGDPPKDYAMPVGWARFGLKMHPRSEPLNVMQKWHVAYHGTRVKSVEPILQTGDLLRPGLYDMDGNPLGVVPGHFDENKKPSGFDIKQVFVSPSIVYAGCEIYAHTNTYEDPETGEELEGRVAFQVRIKPKSYEVDKQTTMESNNKKRIDEHFDNDELEWSTKSSGVIILNGIMIKVDDPE